MSKPDGIIGMAGPPGSDRPILVSVDAALRASWCQCTGDDCEVRMASHDVWHCTTCHKIVRSGDLWTHMVSDLLDARETTTKEHER